MCMNITCTEIDIGMIKYELNSKMLQGRIRPMAIAMTFLSLYWLSFFFSFFFFKRIPMNTFYNLNYDCTCWSQFATSASVDVNGIFCLEFVWISDPHN